MGKRRREPLSLEIEIAIAELSPGGSGVAVCELGGERRAVFVEGVARGERVRVAVDTAQRPARGRVLEVLQPSGARVEPPCTEQSRCGACDWMHLALAEQTDEHRRIVEQLLRTVAKHVQTTSHVAVKDLGYRTRARLHVQAKAARVRVGMFARQSHEPVPVDSCMILDPVLDRARAELANWLDGADGHGEARLSLGRPDSPRLAVLDLRWSGDLPADVFGRLERAVGSTLGGARVFAGEVRIPAKIGDPTPYIVAADGEPLRLAPGGFSQATEAGNALLSRRVAEVARALRAVADGPCVELHAGAGNHTVLLARDRSVVAVERDAEACEAARANLSARSLAARVVESDVAAFAIPRGTKLVVLDPPREGAREVAKALARVPSRHPAIVYVSCDAPTLARDLEILSAGGYVVRSVETFEMFPHTSHVESLVVATSGRA